MNRMKSVVKRVALLRVPLVFVYRVWLLASYLLQPAWEAFAWLFRSKEFTNFTYDLTEINKRYLASVVALVTHTSYSEIAGYLQELEKDEQLRSHIERTIRSSGVQYLFDPDVHFGRRIGWYAFVRATKPRVVVETGVDKGLGSCVITAALMKNAESGYPGSYYGTDINPSAGALLRGNYADYGKILYGDSIESLKALDAEIDLFINDSSHSAQYEQSEYQTVASKLSDRCIILGDNSHATDKLLEFALVTNRNFLFFQEKPFKHWYPGAGIGVAFGGENPAPKASNRESSSVTTC